jgi:hypothetical protein
MQKEHRLGDPISPAIGWRVPLAVVAFSLRQTEKKNGFSLLNIYDYEN